MEIVDRSTTGEDNIVQRPNGSSTSTSLSDNGDAIDTQRSSYNKTRMKWSRDMNIAIMRSHFKAMVLAPNTYTKSMHEYFLEFFPRLAVTAQRVIDQKRTILKRAEDNKNRLRGQWLSKLEIQAIEDEINILHQSTPTNNNHSFTTSTNEQQDDRSEIQESNEHNNTDNNSHRDEILHTIKVKFEEARMIDFSLRKRFQKPPKPKMKKLEESIKKVNEVMTDFDFCVDDFTDFNCLLYATTLIAIERADLEKECIIKPKQPKHRGRKLDWETKMNNPINNIRSDISQVSQMSENLNSAKVKRNSRRMKMKYQIANEKDRTVVLETLKERLSALSHRLKRYKRRQLQFKQNYMFVNNTQKAYKELRGTKIDVKSPPSKEEIESFWGPIYETEKNHNKNANWIKDHNKAVDELNIQQQVLSQWTSDDINEVTKSFQDWKMPGVDTLQNFWWKRFSFTHNILTSYFNRFINDPELAPEWFTFGKTSLAAKKSDPDHPSKYRPITCLPTVYKIFSSLIGKCMKTHIQNNNLMPQEQKGCAPNTLGCIDQLLIDSMVLCDAKENQKISVGSVDRLCQSVRLRIP